MPTSATGSQTLGLPSGPPLRGEDFVNHTKLANLNTAREKTLLAMRHAAYSGDTDLWSKLALVCRALAADEHAELAKLPPSARISLGTHKPIEPKHRAAALNAMSRSLITILRDAQLEKDSGRVHDWGHRIDGIHTSAHEFVAFTGTKPSVN